MFNISKKNAAKYIKQRHARNYKFNYLLNASCFDGREFTKKRKERNTKFTGEDGTLINNFYAKFSCQKIPVGFELSYLMFPIKTKDKLKVFKKLLCNGIDSNLNYVSDRSCFADTNFPVLKFLSESILTINLPFDLKRKEAIYMAGGLNKIRNYLLKIPDKKIISFVRNKQN